MTTPNLTLFNDLPDPVMVPAAPMQDALTGATARVQMPDRKQLELRASDLESSIAQDHRVRLVWAFVERLDLRPLYAQIKAVRGGVGRTPIAPEILLSLWLYATLESVGSARAVARLVQEHDAYRWLCGGVSVNHHTLSDFRVGQGALLDELLTMSVASLVNAGAVTLTRLAQDGMRVRASAGSKSFRRRLSLEGFLTEAKQHVADLKAQVESDPAAHSRAEQAARVRAAREREEKLEAALKRLPELEAAKVRQQGRAKKKVKEARTSMTDADATIMKMPNGGYNAAYNAQFCTDTASQVIVGVDMISAGADQGQMTPMLDQLQQRYQQAPEDYLVDGGYVTLEQIETAAKICKVYAPVPAKGQGKLEPHEPHPKDTPARAEWRARMAQDEAKKIYTLRASTAECVNALARERGLTRLRVRGLAKARSVLLMHALAHNLMRIAKLAPTLLGLPAMGAAIA
jgi:transposase